MPEASSVDRKPELWIAERSLDFPAIYDLICEFHPAGHAVSREIIACIFFEETSFCNREQQTTNGKGPAVGFGQIQIYDPDKIPFFQTLGFNSDLKKTDSSLPLITPAMVIGNNVFSVKMTCKYFQWLGSQGKGLVGILQAQTGGEVKGEKGGNNQSFIPFFIEGGNMLQHAITVDWTRESFSTALNHARSKGFHHNSIAYSGIYAYKKFWEYVIPDSYLQFGF